MTTQVIRPEVAGFVTAVRAQLDDLAPDVVEELTDGLGADLTESLLEPGGALPDPVVYAAELRAAADLPPRRAARGRGGPALAETASETFRQARAAYQRAQRQSWWPLAAQWLGIGAVLWWALRGWFATMLLGQLVNSRWPQPVPPSVTGRLALLLLILLSAELGRRARSGRPRLLWIVLLAVNVAVLVQLPVVLGNVGIRTVVYVDGGVQPPEQGLWSEGREVRNVFPYDSQGRPLQGVQLLTDFGEPLKVGRSAETPIWDLDEHRIGQVPSFDGAGQPLWNVFPLRQQIVEDRSGPVDSAPLPATRPKDTLAPLLPIPAAAATPTPTTSSPPTP
jgi:hypothetical protein